MLADVTAGSAGALWSEDGFLVLSIVFPLDLVNVLKQTGNN